MNESELAKRLRRAANNSQVAWLSDDLRSAADQLDEYYKLNHFWCDECSMLVQVKPGNTVTHYCKGK